MKRGCLRVISLTSELLRYAPSVQLQERLVAERKAGTAPDTVLLVQVGTSNGLERKRTHYHGFGIEMLSMVRCAEH